MTHFILRISDWGVSAAASVAASLERSGGCVHIVGGFMAKKSKLNLPLGKQRSLFEPQTEAAEPPPPPATHQPIEQQETAQIGMTGTAEAGTAPAVDAGPVRCPQCKGPAAPSLNIEHRGEYFCGGACSYGENFYFRP